MGHRGIPDRPAKLKSDLGVIADFAHRLLAPFDDKPGNASVLDELVRRNEHPAQDGYPSSSLGGARGSEVSRPTEVAALRPKMRDETGGYIQTVASIVADMAERATRGSGAISRALDIGEEERGRVSTVPNCVNSNCGKALSGEGPNDRGIAGRCNNCYNWRREHHGLDRPAKLIEAERRRDGQAQAS